MGARLAWSQLVATPRQLKNQPHCERNMNKVLRFSLGAFLIVFLLNNRSAFAETMSLAVLEFGGIGVDDEDLLSLSDQVRYAAIHLLPKDKYSIYTRENITQILADNEVECVEGQCEVETGRNIGADYIISGNVLKQGSELKLVLKFHDTSSAKLMAIEQVTSGSSRGLIKRTPNLSRKLMLNALDLKISTRELNKAKSSLRKSQAIDVGLIALSLVSIGVSAHQFADMSSLYQQADQITDVSETASYTSLVERGDTAKYVAISGATVGGISTIGYLFHRLSTKRLSHKYTEMEELYDVSREEL